MLFSVLSSRQKNCRFAPSSLRAGIRLGSAMGTLLVVGALSACVEKRDAYDVPSVPMPGHFSEDLPPKIVQHPEFAGDAVSIDGQQDPANTIESATASGETTYTQPLEEVLPSWWVLFGSEELNRLVDKALASNPDLHMAALRVEQAEAQYEQAHANEYPVVTGPVSAQVTAPKDGTGSVAAGASITTERSFSAGAKVTYRADVWGERAAQAEAARLRVWQTVLARDNAQKTMIADLVGTYVDYMALNDRLRVAERSQKVLGEMLTAVRERLDRGDSTILDLAQQRAAVRSVEATIPALKLQIAQARHRIAQLTGTTASQLELSDAGLKSLTLPRILPGVPSTLLLRRADVRAAEANLLAADADIDVARAQVLPTFDLSAELGKGNTYLTSWLQPESLFWNLIGSLSATLFDHGAREKRVEQQEARHRELVEGYVSAIYTAVRETEDALARLHFGTERQILQQQATDASAEAVTHSRDSYRYGATDYLTLLDTERTFHTSSDQLYQVTQDRYRGAIDLFVALGGGIELGARLPGEGKRPQDNAPPPDDRNGGIVMVADAQGAPKPLPAPLQAPMPVAKPPMHQPAEEGKSNAVPRPAPRPLPLGTSSPTQGAPEMDLIEKKSVPSIEGWTITLPGLFNTQGLESTWRTLQTEFGDSLNGLSLEPQILDDTTGSSDLGRSWFKLAIGPFKTMNDAQKVCLDLGKQGLRCQSIEPRR